MLEIMLEYQNIKTFLQKAMFPIGMFCGNMLLVRKL